MESSLSANIPLKLIESPLNYFSHLLYRPLQNQTKVPDIRKMAETATNGDSNGAIPEVEDVSAVTKKARDVVAEIEAEEQRELEESRKKQREPPVVFKDVLDVRVEFDALVGLIDGKLSPEEQQSLEELHQYMLEDEGSWALGDSFLLFVGKNFTYLFKQLNYVPEMEKNTNFTSFFIT